MGGGGGLGVEQKGGSIGNPAMINPHIYDLEVHDLKWLFTLRNFLFIYLFYPVAAYF